MMGSSKFLHRPRNPAIFLTLAALLIVPLQSAKQLSRVGEWPGYARGPVNSIIPKSSKAYVAAGSAGLLVFDLENPQRPNVVGNYKVQSHLSGVAMKDEIAFLTQRENILEIVDMTKTDAPKALSRYRTAGSPNSPVLSGNFALIGNSRVADSDLPGLEILDISDLQNPARVSLFPAVRGAGVLACRDRLAVVVGLKGSSCALIDWSDPEEPVLLGDFVPDGSPSGAALYQNFVIVTANRIREHPNLPFGPGGVQIYDISKPSSPVRVGAYARTSDARSLTIVGEKAYVPINGAVEILSLRNPSDPSLFTRISRALDDLQISGNLLFGSAELARRFEIVELDATDSVKVVASYDISGMTQSIAASTNRAYVADLTAGLRIVDLTDPARPIELGRTSEPLTCYDVKLVSHYAMLTGAFPSEFGRKLHVADVRDATSPVLVTRSIAPAHEIAIESERLYAISGDDRLQAFDISNPRSPAKLGKIWFSGFPESIAVEANRAYVSWSQDWADGGFYIVDAATPLQLRKIGEYSAGAPCSGIAVSSGFVFLSCGVAGLQIVDVSDPQKPTRVGSYAISNETGSRQYYAGKLTVFENLVFVAAGEGGVHIVDVRDPTVPKLVAVYDTRSSYQNYPLIYPSGYANNLIIQKETLMVSAATYGFHVVDLTPLMAPVLAVSQELQLSIQGFVGRHYQLEYSHTVDDSSTWIKTPPVVLTNSLQRLDRPTEPAGIRFFRAALLPN